ncbi:MAG: SusC/RagA family TonB-linked outer membrane protein [Gemmatimonadales bacterium]
MFDLGARPSTRRGLGVALATLALSVPSAWAQQQAIITGRVTSDKGQPLAGATVVVGTTNFGASTAANGSYQVTVGAQAARGQNVTLTARMLGFRPKTVQIQLTIGTQERNFELVADPLRLDELVVTGVSEATSTKKLTFAVGKVSEAELQQAPAVTALGALQGKVAGVSIQSSTGMPGAAPQIKLRGATSITGTSDPLIIVDGTITRYSLADIASEDIERVEVIKGAAAASLYGSDAANGVIQIFTRRGANLADGRIQVTARGEFGRSSTPGAYPVTQHHSYILKPDGSFLRRADQSRVLPSVCTASDAAQLGAPCPTRKDALGRDVAVDIQDGLYQTNANAQDILFDPGAFYTQYVSLGQRRGRTNFNASFQNTQNEGSVFNVAGFKRQNYRVNIDQVLTDNIDISFNAFYGRSNNDEANAGGCVRGADSLGTTCNGGQGGAFFGIAFLEPHIDPLAGCTKSADGFTCPTTQDIGSQKIGTNADGSPFNTFIRDKRSNAANPLYNLYAIKQERARSRFTGGGRIRWRPLSWLSAEGNYNFDQVNEDFAYREPVNLYTAAGSATPGRFQRQTDNNRTYNAGAQLTGVWRLDGGGPFKNLGITTKAAYLYEDQEDRRLYASAQKFSVKDVPEFPGTEPQNQRAFSQTEVVRNRNIFGITTLDFNDKVILDGLIRRDGSSLFGPDARFATYWRASGAVRVPQLLGLESGPEEFRIRASYGTAGLRPPYRAQYEVLLPISGVFVKNQLGNKGLRPAKSSELEIGTNIELAQGRFTFEYNYSDKNTKDQIIQAPLLATTGFISQWQNVGALNSKTHEVAVGAQIINSRDFALQMTLTGDRTRETITDWPLPDAGYGPSAGFSPFQFAPGVRLGQMRGQKWVRTLEDLYRDPAKQAASGAGQTWSPDSVVVNYDGYMVRKAVRGANGERPIALVTCTATNASGACTTTTNIHDIGIAAPDFRMGMNTTFAYKRFSATGLLDWSQGGQIYNGTAHWGNQDCASELCDQFDKPAAERIAEGFYQVGLYNGASANEAFVEDATFLKLRELSVNYTFSKNDLNRVGLGRWLGEVRVGVIGRNLFTWTPYTGLDPEVAPLTELNGGQAAFRTRMDWFQYPQFRTFTASIEIAF